MLGNPFGPAKIERRQGSEIREQYRAFDCFNLPNWKNGNVFACAGQRIHPIACTRGDNTGHIRIRRCKHAIYRMGRGISRSENG